MSRQSPHAAGTTLPAEQSDLLRLLAYSYDRHGFPERAAALLAALHALAPDDEGVTLALAHAQLRSGKPEQALVLLDALVESGDDSAITHLLRSQSLVRTGRLPEAARSMRFYVSARSLRTES